MARFAGRAGPRFDTERLVPRAVAKAIRFMRDNLGVHLTVAEIAIAAATSERTLRRQFRRFTGQSPVAFHRNLRLEATRRTLHNDHADTDITAAAGAHGFSHFGHFTAQYRQRFGELPSETLRSTRETLVQLPARQVHGSVTLVVQPFTSAQSAELTLAGATTDRLISALGRVPWVNVLGPRRNRPAAAPSHLAAPRNAQYAVCGCVHSFNGRVQVTVRLFEVATRRHLWGDAFEGETKDPVALEKNVIEGVVSAVPIWLRRAEARRIDRKPPPDRTAYDLTMRALRDASALTEAMNERALKAVDRARSIDPCARSPQNGEDQRVLVVGTQCKRDKAPRNSHFPPHWPLGAMLNRRSILQVPWTPSGNGKAGLPSIVAGTQLLAILADAWYLTRTVLTG